MKIFSALFCKKRKVGRVCSFVALEICRNFRLIFGYNVNNLPVFDT